MSQVPRFKKQLWTALEKYFKELSSEYKRNGTVEGKALGSKEESAAAQRALARVGSVISKKAGAVVREPARKKAAGKGKESAGRKAKGFSKIPAPSEE